MPAAGRRTRVIYARRVRHHRDPKAEGGVMGRRGSVLARPPRDEPEVHPSRGRGRSGGEDLSSSNADKQSMSRRQSRRIPSGKNRGDTRKKPGKFLAVVLWVGGVLFMVFSLAYIVYMVNKSKGKPAVQGMMMMAYLDPPPSQEWTEGGSGDEWIT